MKRRRINEAGRRRKRCGRRGGRDDEMIAEVDPMENLYIEQRERKREREREKERGRNSNIPETETETDRD